MFWGENIVNEILLSPWTAIIMLLIFVGFSIGNIFYKRLLSKGAVFYITMLLAPAAIYSSVGVFLIIFFEQIPLKTVLANIGCAFLFSLSFFVYIRGHIFPAVKISDDAERERLIGSRRLVITGILGTLMCGTFSVFWLIDIITSLSVLGNGPLEILQTLGAFLVALLIPLINLIVVAYMLIVGSQFAIWAAVVFLAFLQCLLVTNGCIRYILTKNSSKLIKALLIIPTLIPGVNIIMGICYSVKITCIFKKQKKERSLKNG